jgi:hypothetical protein
MPCVQHSPDAWRNAASTVAYPRVSAAKTKTLKPYKADLNQLLAITNGEEDDLYVQPVHWDLSLDRMELHEQYEGRVQLNAKGGNTEDTTLVFHPFYFKFVVPITEQYCA